MKVWFQCVFVYTIYAHLLLVKSIENFVYSLQDIFTIHKNMRHCKYVCIHKVLIAKNLFYANFVFFFWKNSKENSNPRSFFFFSVVLWNLLKWKNSTLNSAKMVENCINNDVEYMQKKERFMSIMYLLSSATRTVNLHKIKIFTHLPIVRNVATLRTLSVLVVSSII